MSKVTIEYALQVAAESQATITAHGGKVLATLPYLDRSGLRPQSELIGRALALNAMIDLNYDVQPEVIKAWVEQHGVTAYLTPHEASMLNGGPITQQDKDNLSWALDAVWTLMWAGKLVPILDFTKPIPDGMYEMCPHIPEGEGREKFETMQLRSFDEIYRELDLYYRLHWYAFQYQLRGELDTFDLSRIIERRRALEWLLTPERGWDRVSMNT